MRIVKRLCTKQITMSPIMQFVSKKSLWKFDFIYKNFEKYLYLRKKYTKVVNLSIVCKVVKDERKFDIDWWIRSEAENRLKFRGEY